LSLLEASDRREYGGMVVEFLHAANDPTKVG